jgi:hypothetical protein
MKHAAEAQLVRGDVTEGVPGDLPVVVGSVAFPEEGRVSHVVDQAVLDLVVRVGSDRRICEGAASGKHTCDRHACRRSPAPKIRDVLHGV